MDARTLLSKVVTLIYHSRQINILDHDDLIKTNLNTIKTDTPDQNFIGNGAIKKFKEYCFKLLEERDPIPKENVIMSLSIILENDPKLLQTLKDSIEPERDETAVKRITSNLIKTLNGHYKEYLAIEVISKASYDFKFNRSKMGNVSDYLKNIIAELEPLSNVSTHLKDPAVVSELDFENTETVDAVIEEVKNLNTTAGIYRLGWHAMNRMTQGGIRPGETVFICANQHGYKSSLSLTVFMQVALYNRPIMKQEDVDAGKKPLMLRISFEDPLTSNLQFMYQYLRASNGNPVSSKELTTTSTAEMRDTILNTLKVTGFSIKMMRVDPSQWSYSDVFNKVIELEAQGYKVLVLALDYVTLLPTKGCIQGPTGTDKRDLIRRIRNFTSARGIIFISPLQLSTEAKQMIRNGTPGHMFVRECLGKDLIADSKQIMHEVDLLLILHLFTHKRRKYLAVGLDKHRLPSVAPDEDRHFYLPFPGPNIPVLPDVDGDDTSMQSLPKGDYDQTSSAILDEIAM